MSLKKYKDQLLEGQITENSLREYLSGTNWKYLRDATENENKCEKWDQLWSLNKQEYKIEIKGKKKTSRANKNYSQDTTVIELVGISYKKNNQWVSSVGWLYGKADLFAFAYNDIFLLVDKIKLQQFIQSKELDLNHPLIKGKEPAPVNIVYCRKSQPTERCVYVLYSDMINYCLFGENNENET